MRILRLTSGRTGILCSAPRAPGSPITLRAWLEVEDGKIVGYGQGGGGRVSSTLLRLGGMRVVVEAVSYPELTPEPGDRTVMQARKESLWRHLLGVVYALTVVFTPG